MRFDRRGFLAASLASTSASFNTLSIRAQGRAPDPRLGIPGPYPGRVVAVEHPSGTVGGQYQAGPVREIMHRGMMELTGADNWADAWRTFVRPGEVVGIKLNAVGRPFVISSPEVFLTIVDGLEAAGIRRNDIVAYDRYGEAFLSAGFDKWLPDGVRWTSASPKYPKYQLDMDGYDRDHYMEMPLFHPDYVAEYRADDPHARRSYVAKFLTTQVDKMINLSVLKHHQSAGVTLALKNMSHGLVNNVSRSHATTTANACGIFIPAVVDLPVIRRKVVLQILDGLIGAYHGGPGRTVEHYRWDHQTMYFSTDPVAMDKVGWQVIDEKRAAVGMAPIALMKPDKDSRWLNGQVEHIELAASLGLGVYADDKIDLRRVRLG